MTDDAAQPAPPGGGLRAALARTAAAAIELLRTRVELAAIELAEQGERAKMSILLLVIAATFFAFAVLCASALVVLIFWDTYRIAAIAAVTAVHVVIGVAALLRLRSIRRDASPPFHATLAELERDRRWLAGEIEETLRRQP